MSHNSWSSEESKAPTFLDDEERDLAAALEREDFASTGDRLDPARLDVLRKAARHTVNDEREKISLRIPRHDLSRLKSKALAEGIPYQTLINSLIRRYVTR
ncbi:MAG: CopG family antitoxin [Beijerinckiaceae bacterium]